MFVLIIDNRSPIISANTEYKLMYITFKYDSHSCVANHFIKNIRYTGAWMITLHAMGLNKKASNLKMSDVALKYIDVSF